jgi:7,8-didemethyl-8-hydroxy-5-deazariboflavin synthase CofG subunit
MAVRVLEETGLLPHLNPGVMSWEEMNRLKPVSPSMGMMLETTSRRLFEEKGQAHFGSPDKDPAVRLRVLEDAGRLSIPFTTGLLVGIGETLAERAETIFALRATLTAYGAVQEVIVQTSPWRSTAPRSPSPGWSSDPGPACRRRRTWSTSRSAAPCSRPGSTTGAGSPP